MRVYLTMPRKSRNQVKLQELKLSSTGAPSPIILASSPAPAGLLHLLPSVAAVGAAAADDKSSEPTSIHAVDR